MFYESEFEEFLIDTLHEKFGICGKQLEEYLLLRYIVVFDKNEKNLKIDELAFFIVDELFIAPVNCKFKYRDTDFYIDSHKEQSITNILLNMRFISGFFNQFLHSDEDKAIKTNLFLLAAKIKEHAKKASSKEYKKVKNYSYVYSALSMLNEIYRVSLREITVPDYIYPLTNYYYSGRTLEDISKSMMNTKFLKTNDFSVVTEKDVEEFICKNVETLFKGKKLKARQFDLGAGGIVDIILEDDEFEYIIEVKNKKDDRLIWQTMKYKQFYKSKKPVKIITIAPEYSEIVIEELKKHEYISVILFTIEIVDRNIEKIKLKKL